MIFWWSFPVFAAPATSLEHVRLAAAKIGPEHWSRVLQIENRGRRSAYPKTVYALAFEFGGILWFYTDANGTQSLSRQLHNLPAEQADLAPLLCAIDPGFVAHEVLEPATGGVEDGRRGQWLPNGCFIESVAALRMRVARGEAIRRAQLVSFYGNTSAGTYGHTVLAYETPAGAFVLDAQSGDAPVALGPKLPGDARAVAAVARPEANVTRARWVPTTMPAPRPLLAAAGSIVRAPARQ